MNAPDPTQTLPNPFKKKHGAAQHQATKHQFTHSQQTQTPTDNNPSHHQRKKSRYRSLIEILLFLWLLLFFTTLYLSVFNSNEYRHKSLIFEKLSQENKELTHLNASLQLELSLQKIPDAFLQSQSYGTKKILAPLKKEQIILLETKEKNE